MLRKWRRRPRHGCPGTIAKPWNGPFPSPIPRRVGMNYSRPETKFCDYAALPKGHSAPDVLTSNEVRQLLAALEPRERLMVLLDGATGLRQSETFALKSQDVDLKDKQLLGPRTLVQTSVARHKT